jgi:hypothetical protein
MGPRPRNRNCRSHFHLVSRCTDITQSSDENLVYLKCTSSWYWKGDGVGNICALELQKCWQFSSSPWHLVSWTPGVRYVSEAAIFPLCCHVQTDSGTDPSSLCLFLSLALPISQCSAVTSHLSVKNAWNCGPAPPPSPSRGWVSRRRDHHDSEDSGLVEC